MTKEQMYNYIRLHKLAVLSTISPEMKPESALVGIAVTPDLQIIFDTVSESRKYNNLLANSHVSFVIGWDNEQTLQYEGIARIPEQNELNHFFKIYFDVFPDGRDRLANWKNIVYFCVEPSWLRFSDFNELSKQIVEIKF